jgi:heme-degrading monooxygenase HmoA
MAKQNHGLLLLSHGARDKSVNDQLAAMADGLALPLPVVKAFMEQDDRTIEQGVRTLEAMGVDEILVLPLYFPNNDGHMQEVQWELGLREECPTGGHRNLKRVEPKVPVRVLPALGSHPLIGQIIVQRAMAISTDAATESLLLLYPGGEEEGSEWPEIVRGLAEYVSAATKFRLVRPVPMQKEAIAAAVRELAPDGPVLAVPLVISTNGYVTRLIPAMLADLPVVYTPQGLFPEPMVDRAYVRARLGEALQEWEEHPAHAYAINIFRVRLGTGTLLEERFRTRRGVERLEGFCWFEMVKGVVTPAYEEYFVMTRWESAQDFLNWTTSETFRKGHAGTRAPGATAFILTSWGGLYQPRYGTYGRVL